MFRVIVNDHTSLGGPMGSERVTEISSKFFDDKEKAYAYAYKYASKNGMTSFGNHQWPDTEEKFLALSDKSKKRLIGDLGNIGIDVIKIKVE